MPDASFVILGPVQHRLAVRFREEHLDNLHILGSRAYSEVPTYLATFDVGIVPYVLNIFNIESDPLKVYEYLAAGKPVVSVPLPAIEELGDAVLIARDSREFIVQIRRALGMRSQADMESRRNVAAEHSAANIAARLAHLFERASRPR
jgi:glycosyltransferase involved in cell wall biosynthesis